MRHELAVICRRNLGARRLACAYLAVAAAAGLFACGESEPGGATARTITITKTVIPPKKVAKATPPPAPSASSLGVPVSEMLGQMIISAYAGTVPPLTLLDRIKAGEVGGVILYSENTAAGEADTRAEIADLQAAASAGHQPPLLVTTDQEGGEVRRLTWAPPELAPAEMHSAAVARSEGAATGRALRAVGVNLDLAPVSDVERVAGSFLGTRSFGDESSAVAERACAFAEGLASQGVGFTLKHFPGLGRAVGNTDLEPVSITASPTELRDDYGAYERCSSSPDGVVMVSNASYPALTGNSTPAVMSPEIYHNELAAVVGYKGVTISDDLGAGALAHEPAPAERAINAGLDLALYAQGEASVDAYDTLRQDVDSGTIPSARVESAYSAIIALKATIAGGAPQAASGAAQGSSYPENVGAPQAVGAPETIKEAK